MEHPKWFDRICMNLIFLLLALLVLFGGIRTAKTIIEVAKTEQIEIVNNILDGLTADPKSKLSTKKVQDILIKYLKAFFQAVAEFEFLPRNDFGAVVKIINAVPEDTEVLSFSYLGRDLTIRTAQPSPAPVLEMVKALERSQEFSNVVYSYYIDPRQSCIAEITLIAYHYDEADWFEALKAGLDLEDETE